jgi:hypothetical protein
MGEMALESGKRILHNVSMTPWTVVETACLNNKRINH